MFDGLVFGWRTALLTLAVSQMLVLALALSRTLVNRVANRTLAALLIILAGIVTPWLIGFAGFYDRWPWLTFVPVAITLGVAPLLFLYIHALVTGGWPAAGWRHLTPPAAQAVFLTISFTLPMPLKNRWSDLIMESYMLATSGAVIVGFIGYGWPSLSLLRRYRASLARQHSDDYRFAGRWLSRAIGAALLLLLVWLVYAVWDAIAPLGYKGLMGLYVVIAAFGLFLAIEGWRHAAVPFPNLAALAIPDPPSAPAHDWAAQGAAWIDRIRGDAWYIEPELSLAIVARRLGTNTSHLSRALNEGAGVSFSALIAGLRADAVADALRGGSARDLLDLALEAGFNSKASFNRAFLARFAMSPSAYRRAHGANRK